MDRITEKRQLRLDSINANLSLIKQCFSFNNKHQRVRYLTYLQEANVENSVLSAIKNIITPVCGSYNGSIVGPDQWDQILYIMIDHHVLTHPTWEFIMDHGDDELKRRLKNTLQQKLLNDFDQFLKNKKLGTLAADRRVIIAEEILDRIEYTVAKVQTNYNTNEEELPLILDNIIKFFDQVEESMRYLLGDKRVCYNAELMKRNNPLTVIEKLSDIIERLSNDLDSACWDVKGNRQWFNKAREELADMTDRLSKLEKENEHLKDDNDKLQVDVNDLGDVLEKKEQECIDTARELEEKTTEVAEVHNELSKRDHQLEQMMAKHDHEFEQMKRFMELQAESMNNQKVFMQEAIEKQTEQNTALTRNVEDLTSRVSRLTSSVSTIENTVKTTPNTRKAVTNALERQTEQIKDLTSEVRDLKSVLDKSENKMADSLFNDTESIQSDVTKPKIASATKYVNNAVENKEKHVQNKSKKKKKDVSSKPAAMKKTNDTPEVIYSKKKKKIVKTKVPVDNNGSIWEI